MTLLISRVSHLHMIAPRRVEILYARILAIRTVRLERVTAADER